MKTFNHTITSDCLFLQRKYQGAGKYYIRGIFKDAEIGDQISSIPQQGTVTITEIISISDSKGNFKSPELGKNAHVEAVAYDPNYEKPQYVPLHNFGN